MSKQRYRSTANAMILENFGTQFLWLMLFLMLAR